MITKVYAVKDVKVAFMKPFTAANDAVAVRDFTNVVNDDRDRYMSQNYGDMELWCLGEYNDQTGVIESMVEFLVKGADVRKVGD